MIESCPTNVSSSFKMMLEGSDTESDFVSGVVAKALAGWAYGEAKEALER